MCEWQAIVLGDHDHDVHRSVKYNNETIPFRGAIQPCLANDYKRTGGVAEHLDEQRCDVPVDDVEWRA